MPSSIGSQGYYTLSLNNGRPPTGNSGVSTLRTAMNTPRASTYVPAAGTYVPPVQSPGIGFRAKLSQLFQSAAAADDPHSFDLLPASLSASRASVEDHAASVFSAGHLRTILSSPQLLAKFAAFLERRDTDGLQVLVYYLNVQKALRALRYAHAVAAGLEPPKGREFADGEVYATDCSELTREADVTFDALMDELAAFVTQTLVDVTSHNVTKRVMGTLRADLKEAVDGLGECFCLTDPNRPDNPIILMSEGFTRVTQYGLSYVVGVNCRFLQGPHSSRKTVRRLGDAIRAGREVSEMFINYRRDGSPFMNLVMCAPLWDSNGVVRYTIGAQVDVTQPFLQNIGLDSMTEFLERESNEAEAESDLDEFRELAELFNEREMTTTRLYGGRLERGRKQQPPPPVNRANSRARSDQRIVIEESSEEYEPAEARSERHLESPAIGGGLLKGVYQHYMLVRPYPSLRILFTSPSMRTPGIHHMPFLDKVRGSERAKTQLADALRTGTPISIKIHWITNRNTDEGRERWAHCTPLLDAVGNVGVWMIVLVAQESQEPGARRDVPEGPPLGLGMGLGLPMDHMSMNGTTGSSSSAWGKLKEPRARSALYKFSKGLAMLASN